MQVFLCWSGPAGHKIAEAFHGFLGDVIQDLKPFLSSESIRKGQNWSSVIGNQLKESNYGIVCLTKDNLDARWIMFESGALSKNLAESRVTTLLAGIQPTDVLEPLSQFQHTRTDRDDVFKLTKDLNALLPESQRLTEDRLTRSFARCWDDLEAKLNHAMASSSATTTKVFERPTGDMVAELLELVRELKRELVAKREFEERAERDRFEELQHKLAERESRMHMLMGEHESLHHELVKLRSANDKLDEQLRVAVRELKKNPSR
ncbi:MAG: toll-Interleukin receptor [Proteobacteria bacterium]|nr:toll-Interleukin receptor [Pseudomonadota bacterium]